VEKNLWMVQRKGPLIWETDYFEIKEEDRVMMEPYKEEEKQMHKPMGFF